VAHGRCRSRSGRIAVIDHDPRPEAIGLCLDTTGPVLNLGLFDAQRIIGSRCQEVGNRQAELLVAELDRLLREAGLALSDIGYIAVSTGPGSFTGIRIGLSFTKGLAMARGLPLVPLNSLDAMAWGRPPDDFPLSPMLDAKKGEIYTALYAGDTRRLMGDHRAIEPLPWLEQLPPGTHVWGSGAQRYREMIERMPGNPLNVAAGPAGPEINGLVALARSRRDLGGTATPDAIDAFYIRPSEAELKQGRG
jgi:tRNA threonylcarbamoyladenosine biosynthesis protein TsaB